MSEPTLEQLASRIAQLEQRVRSFALVLLAVIVLTAFFQIWQVWAHKTVQADRFALRSSDGKTRALLSVSPDGTPQLGMLDAGDKLRAMLSIGADGAPGLAMNDADGTPRVLLSVLPNGTPSLGMYDAGRKLRATLGTDPSGTPALTLFDAEQKVQAKVGH